MLRRQHNPGKTHIQVRATNAGRRDKAQAGLPQKALNARVVHLAIK